MSEVHVHRWPAAALFGDAVRGVVAFGAAVLLISTVSFGSLEFFLVLGLIVVFGWYLGGTLSRLRSVIEVSEEGLRLSGGLWAEKTIKWAELQCFELRYYSLRRDRKDGWMDLKLRDGGQTISIDDRLERFHAVLARAWDAARAAEVGVSDSTHANLIAAGIFAKPGT